MKNTFIHMQVILKSFFGHQFGVYERTNNWSGIEYDGMVRIRENISILARFTKSILVL